MRPWLKKKAGDSLIWAKGKVNDIEHNVLSLYQDIYIVRYPLPSPVNISIPSGIFFPILPTTSFSEISHGHLRGNYHLHTQSWVTPSHKSCRVHSGSKLRWLQQKQDSALCALELLPAGLTKTQHWHFVTHYVSKHNNLGHGIWQAAGQTTVEMMWPDRFSARETLQGWLLCWEMCLPCPLLTKSRYVIRSKWTSTLKALLLSQAHLLGQSINGVR